MCDTEGDKRLKARRLGKKVTQGVEFNARIAVANVENEQSTMKTVPYGLEYN